MNTIQRVQSYKRDTKGNMVIMLDDEDRENEGDLVYVAPLSTALEKLILWHSRKRINLCISVTKETANRLQLNPMVSSNTSSYETAFTVSVDAADASTGISAKER